MFEGTDELDDTVEFGGATFPVVIVSALVSLDADVNEVGSMFSCGNCVTLLPSCATTWTATSATCLAWLARMSALLSVLIGVYNEYNTSRKMGPAAGLAMLSHAICPAILA